MEYYDYVKEELKFLNNSEIRLKILTDLSKRPYRLSEFKKNALVSYSSISTNVHKLCNEGYVKKENTYFKLTNIGKIYLIAMMEFHDTVETVNRFSEFWLDHDVDALSIKYLKEISSLDGSQLIKSAPSDIYRTHEEFRNLFSNAKHLKVIFPYLHPEYPRLIRKLVSNTSKVEVLVPDVIKEAFVKNIGESIVRNAIKKNRLSIKSIRGDVKLALAVSEDFVSIGLFKKDGTYDQSRLLVSDKNQAIKWANKLFKNYDKEGIKIKLRELNI